MNFLQLVYKVLGVACTAALIPPVWLHRKVSGGNLEYLRQRLGFYPLSLHQRFGGHPRLWMHAVSVGEVGAAAAIRKNLTSILSPGQVALSVTTEHGLTRAGELAGEWAACFYAPIDLDWANHRALRMIRPTVLALVETEIWPNLIIGAHRLGIPVVLVNGRISERNVKYYQKIRPLMQHTLAHVNCFSMISDHDAERILSLGADADRVLINGNAKFDASIANMAPGLKQRTDQLYQIAPDTPVIVAGSTRFPEERILLDAFTAIRRDYPKTVLIIAPRHIRRTDQIEQWAIQRGLSCQRRSRLTPQVQPRTAPVVILDTIGELAATYSVATLVFCGGSLVAKGGQNLLEPALWGKPVICGPSMEDFAEAHACIERAGGCVTVHNHQELTALVMEWIEQPQKAQSIGQAARSAVNGHRGAAARHAAIIDSFLSNDP
jgi:3-deoxy-D-manno-octulosonic-acid transferase